MKRLFLILIALAFILETPRNKILGLFTTAFDKIGESREQTMMAELPNPLIFMSYNGHAGNTWDTRSGHVFRSTDNVMKWNWNLDDPVSWSRNSDGSFTLWHSKSNTSTSAVIVSFRSTKEKGYY